MSPARRRHGARDALQTELPLEAPPRTADELLERLRTLGLTSIARCRLTQNRAVMVSFSGSELRVHRAYLDAPSDVLRAIVLFVHGRTRPERRAAQETILGFPVRTARRAPARRHERSHPEDEALELELTAWHRLYNQRFFGGTLRPISIRISGRMRSRLGQYSAPSAYGEPAEIAISRAHIRRHGPAEVLHTLLHEMVHQWQAQRGHAIDHGPIFRAKARQIGIEPRARRELRPAARTGRVVSTHDPSLRAARKG